MKKWMALNMIKLMLLMLVLPVVNAWQFNWFYVPQQPVLEQNCVLQDDMQKLNNIPEITKTLEYMGYNRIGVIDVTTQNDYTVLVNDDGLITCIEEGLNDYEVLIRVNLLAIRYYADKGDYEEIINYVSTPIQVKLKFIRLWW